MSFEEPNKGWVENETALPEKNKISTILEIQGNASAFSKTYTCFERLRILRRNNPSWISISEKTWNLQQTSVADNHHGLFQCGHLFRNIEHIGVSKCQNIFKNNHSVLYYKFSNVSKVP